MKCVAAVSLGRRGGRRSAETRMAVTTSEQRSRWAQRAAVERWDAARARAAAKTARHKIIDPLDKGTTRRPNGTEVHLWECRSCGGRVWRNARSGFAHDGQTGKSRGFYKTRRESDQRWPYGATQDELILAVNEAIPRNVPEQVREEACQELVLAVLEGRVTRERMCEAAKEALAAARSGYQFSARFEVSMDIPLGQDARTPLRDLLAGPSVLDVARVVSDEDGDPGWLAA